MRQEVLLSSLHRRVHQRTNLLLVLLVGGLFSLFRWVMGNPNPSFFDLLFPFLLLLAHLALSPIPWQWTGDDEAKTGLGRGFLQSLGFSVAWVGLFLVCVRLFAPAPMRPEGPPPPMSESAHGPPFRPRPFNPVLGLGLINVGFAIAFGWGLAEKEASEVKASVMAELLRQARSQALQNQLKPHVLYNALNSLSELVHEDPPAAEEMVARLADLYRMLTLHGETDRVPLGEERRLVEAYLAMEQMRLGDRLQVRWEWPEWADGIVLPPLFLQPMVENAIKHGISPSDAGGELVITCGRDVDATFLKVENTGRPLEMPCEKGVGLRNLGARQALWAEVSGSFTLETRGERTVAELHWVSGESS